MNKTVIIIGSLTLLGVGAYLYFKPQVGKIGIGATPTGITPTGITPTGTTPTGTTPTDTTPTGIYTEVGEGTNQSPIVYNTPNPIEISPASLSNLQAVVYLNKYPDLIRLMVFGKDLKKVKDHWVLYGKKENRTIPVIKNSISKPTQLSDNQALIYLAKYSDLFNAFGINLSKAKQHWVELGKEENRTIDIVI